MMVLLHCYDDLVILLIFLLFLCYFPAIIHWKKNDSTCADGNAVGTAPSECQMAGAGFFAGFRFSTILKKK